MDGVAVFDKHADEYDRWFDENQQIYQAEVNALRRFIPKTGLGVEVGVGTGRFSTPFGIRIGVEPSRNMGTCARRSLPGNGSNLDKRLGFPINCGHLWQTLYHMNQIEAGWKRLFSPELSPPHSIA